MPITVFMDGELERLQGVIKRQKDEIENLRRYGMPGFIQQWTCGCNNLMWVKTWECKCGKNVDSKDIPPIYIA